VVQGPVRPGVARDSKAAPVRSASSDDRAAVSPLELLGFVARAARRHLLSCVSLFALVALVGVAAVYAIPPVYESTAKIYVTQNSALTASLASGRRGDDVSAALRGLREAVLNQENLLALVREAKLADSWQRTRTWPLRWKDQIMAALFGAPSKADVERALVEILETNMWVYAEEGTSIRFTAWWRDPEAAFRLVQLAQRNFLNGRTNDEVASINRAIALLEAEQKRADDAIGPAIKDMQQALAKARDRSPPQPATAAQPSGAPPRVAPAPIVSEVNVERLQEIRRAQREVLDPWQRRLADLKFQLTELRAIFGPAHPTVTQQEAKLAAASETPPELARLRDEEAELVESVRGVGTAAEPVGTVRRPTTAQPVRLPAALPREEDPELAAARVRIETALGKSRDVSSRLDAARMEFATAEASAKHRYAVVEAPEQPNRPFKPKRPVLLAGVLAAALLLGFLTGAARELATGRLVEAWQVRKLGLDVIGEIDLEEFVKRG
jgi:uncharacterized protein involved in exopolysaccharide biosynthesis